MCFSAPVSFAASAALAVLGGAAVHTARKLPDKRQMFVAIAPLLFSLQQALEGFQWLTICSGTTSTGIGYGFLFFAFLLWPVYVPTGVVLLDPQKRRLAKWFVALGVFVSAALLVIMVREPLHIVVLGQSIDYHFVTLSRPLLTGLYIFAVCGSLFISSVRAFRRIGILLFMSAAFSLLISQATFVSVWCFFAALISLSAYVYLRKRSVPRAKNS